MCQQTEENSQRIIGRQVEALIAILISTCYVLRVARVARVQRHPPNSRRNSSGSSFKVNATPHLTSPVISSLHPSGSFDQGVSVGGGHAHSTLCPQKPLFLRLSSLVKRINPLPSSVILSRSSCLSFSRMSTKLELMGSCSIRHGHYELEILRQTDAKVGLMRSCTPTSSSTGRVT